MTINSRYAFHVLDVSPDSSMAEITRSYRLLVQVWHPDRFFHNEQLRAFATERLQLIIAAYKWIERSRSSPVSASMPESNSDQFSAPEPSVDRLLTMSTAYELQGRYDLSVQLLEEALSAIESVPVSTDTNIQTLILSRIAVAYFETGHPEQGKTFAERVSKFCKPVTKAPSLVTTDTLTYVEWCMGKLCRYQAYNSAAESFFLRAAHRCTPDQKNRTLQATLLAEAAHACAEQNEYERAEEFARQALTLCESDETNPLSVINLLWDVFTFVVKQIAAETGANLTQLQQASKLLIRYAGLIERSEAFFEEPILTILKANLVQHLISVAKSLASDPPCAQQTFGIAYGLLLSLYGAEHPITVAIRRKAAKQGFY